MNLDQNQSEDTNLNILLESESWRFVSTHARFGLYKLSSDPRKYQFSLQEIEEETLLPEDLRVKLKVYDKVFRERDAATIS